MNSCYTANPNKLAEQQQQQQKWNKLHQIFNKLNINKLED